MVGAMLSPLLKLFEHPAGSGVIDARLFKQLISFLLPHAESILAIGLPINGR